jgi:hypothetical protein
MDEGYDLKIFWKKIMVLDDTCKIRRAWDIIIRKSWFSSLLLQIIDSLLNKIINTTFLKYRSEEFSLFIVLKQKYIIKPNGSLGRTILSIKQGSSLCLQACGNGP